LRRHGLGRDAILAALQEENKDKCQPPLETPEVEKIADSISRYEPDKEADYAAVFRTGRLLQESEDDEGHAQCVFMLHGAEYRHCDAYGWMHYNGKYWQMDSAEAQLDRAVVRTLKERRSLAAEAGREKLVRIARPTASNVRNTKYLFRSLVITDVNIFDRDPDRINCQNGVLDLRTGDLEPHKPEQFFTYCLPIEYNPQADPTSWVDLLLQWTNGDRAVVDYLQTAIGYSLTGHTWEECLFYLYGPPRSGKGTFTETLLAMLGKKPLATEVDFASFTAARENDSQNFDLAPLKPCRFVVASESSKYRTLNAAKVKALTGGNDIMCAFKHKDHFTYRPEFKIWLSSNWPVNADVDDDALWYRVHVICFPNSYVDREDKRLKARCKGRQNLEAVLAWAIKGAIRWYNQDSQGLQVPKQIKAATEQHRIDLDYVGQWLEECIEQTGNPNHFVANAAIYLSYQNWCKENGVEPKRKRSLSMELDRKGLQTQQIKWDPSLQKTVRGITGIALT